MTSAEAVQALKEWTAATLPELLFVYDHAVITKPEGLPDAVVELRRSGVAPQAETRFRFWDVQQGYVYFVETDVSFMVRNDDTAVGAAQLQDFENRLLASVLASPSLDGRVPFASPEVEFDFTAPFVEYEDGTKGRVMTMTIAVGDLVEATS